MASYDPEPDVERLPRDRLEAMQDKALRTLFQHLEDRSKFYRYKYLGQSKKVAMEPREFSALPLISKRDLLDAQGLNLPWGGLLGVSVSACSILGFTNAIAAGMEDYNELQLAATSADMGRRAEAARRAFAQGGSGKEDRTAIAGEVARSINHHAMLAGLVALGSTPFQIGRGLTLRHVRHTLPVLEPTQMLTHPTYARTLARLASEDGVDLPVERLFLWGEVGPSVPSVRAELQRLWGGAEVRDIYAMEELGIIAAECAECGAMHGMEDHFRYEVVDVGNGIQVPDGERGELVVTMLQAEAIPLVRYRTGDLVVAHRGPCECGRTHVRISVVGRVVDTSRGTFPVDIATIEDEMAKAGIHDEAYRVIVDEDGPWLEVDDGAHSQLTGTLEEALKATGPPVRVHSVGNLPRFHHRATRVIGIGEVGLWHAQAEEQRRLEG